MRSYYAGITLFKLAGSVLVVAAHVMLMRYMEMLPGQSFLQFTSLAMRVVVPCFYVIAGFLAYKGWQRAASPSLYIKRYAKRIGIIYLLFFSFFVIEHTLPALMRDGLGVDNLLLQAKIGVVALLLNGPFVQFWFIPPLLFGVVAAWLLLRRWGTLYCSALVLACFIAIQFIAGTLMNLSLFPQEGNLYQEYIIPFLTRYIGFGFVFVVAGALLAKHEQWFLRLAVKRWLAWVVPLSVIEIGLLLALSDWSTDYKLTFTVLPNTLLLFFGILKINSEKVRRYHREISIFSMVAFFGHILMMRVNLLLLGWDAGDLTVLQDLVWLLLTLLECVLVTLAVVKVPLRRIHVDQHKKAAS